jgi:hypothetical protein
MKNTIVSLLVLLLALSNLRAATITWGTNETVSADSDVFTNGTLQYAYDWDGVNATVNGIAFTGTSITNGGVNVSLNGIGSNSHAYTSASAPFSTLSTAYQNILAGGEFGGAVNATVILNNLTVGHSYAVQVWGNDPRGGSEAGRTDAVSSGNVVTLAYNVPANTGGVGQYTIGVFTASTSSQTFILLGGASTQLNALLVSDVTATGYQPVNPPSSNFTLTGSMDTARDWQIATLLTNGQVLVAGGFSGSAYQTSAEIFNPSTGTWTVTNSMNAARYGAEATLLTNGTVLVEGGSPDGTNFLSSAEVFDPTTGIWTLKGSMSTNRNFQTATLLPNGKVLVEGGNNSKITELYDPTTGAWTTSGTLNFAHGDYQTATLLPNGKVLVVGGSVSGVINSAELYNPDTGTWTLTGSLNIARYKHTATLLPNGKVLVAGGYDLTNYLSSAEIYDPVTGIWTITGALNIARYWANATLLPNGKVLVEGGICNGGVVTNSAEIYDPSAGTWTMTGSMITTRRAFTATLLTNGNVLVTGGVNNSGGHNSNAELYGSSNITVIAFSLTNVTNPPGGVFQFNFTNTPNVSFIVYGTTNLAVPFSNWTVLNGLTEISSGQYQFTDLSATNNPQFFYRVRSP